VKKCLNCNKNPAQKNLTLGYLPCASCQNQTKLPNQNQHEFTSESIKQQRKEFKDDIIQPFRQGVVSKEYLKAHGTKGIDVSAKDLKKARNVWNNNYYRD